jgi:DNA-binding NtrC family response regulator
MKEVLNKKVLIVEDQFVEANDLKLMLQHAGYEVCGLARSVDGALELYHSEQPSLVLVDIFLKGSRTGIELGKFLAERSTPFIYISANSNKEILEAAKATQPAGFIVKPFRERDLLVTLEIAQYRHANSVDAFMRKEATFKAKISDIAVGNASTEDKLLDLCRTLQTHLPFDYVLTTRISKIPQPKGSVSFLRVGFNEYQTVGIKELGVITNRPVTQLEKLLENTPYLESPVVLEGNDFIMATAETSLKKLIADTFKLQCNLTLPVPLSDGDTFILDFYSKRADAYLPEHLMAGRALSNAIGHTVNLILGSGLAGAVLPEPKIPSIQDRTHQPSGNTFSKIIGKSHLLLNVFDSIEQVAPVDTSVLILGESGTGKERIADCIHNLSPRKNAPLIKINCAALPVNLVESELFGHEKGAFTGATDKRIGKFELANKGTIFLDEIGEIPLELQAKLLRVLQEKEIERVGGSGPIKVDVRIVAATNRNLEKEVGAGRFRLDLYYRLNIFPILVPALRDRAEDIPLLVDYFIKNFNGKTGKSVRGISHQLQQKMAQYSWPGNIRELENLTERGVLMAKNDLIQDIDFPNINGLFGDKTRLEDAYMPVKSIDENERDHIISVLKKCGGKIYGAGGAAELLGVPPTTLNSKMKRLDIKKGFE